MQRAAHAVLLPNEREPHAGQALERGQKKTQWRLADSFYGSWSISRGPPCFSMAEKLYAVSLQYNPMGIGR